MGEPRRIELVTVDSTPKVKSSKKRRETVRLEVELGDTTDKTCPEFSYTELLKKRLNKADDEPFDPNDPYGENEDHDRLMALAKSFEAKYGPKPGKKKKHTARLEDVVDLGEGYDESDPFVDNSEAYDEYIPDNLTTAYGGFYINTGKLDMRQVSDDSDDDEDDFYATPIKKKKKLKRLLDSDSEVNDTNGLEGGDSVTKKKRGRPKKKRFDEYGNEIFVKEKKRKKLMDDDGLPWKKKMKGQPGRPRIRKTVTELIKQQVGESTPNSESAMESSQSSSSNMDVPITNDITNGSTNSCETTPKVSEAPNLPDRLPSRLLESVEKIKKAAKASVSGKQKFFTHSVNRILLDIDLHVQSLPSRQRLAIYEHTASFLPCGYQTLIKRAAKLRQTHQEQQTHLEGPQENLRDAISRVMPDMIKKHESEVEAAQLAFNASNNANGDNKDMENHTSEKGEDDKKEKRRFMPPRRKFEWNAEISGLLCELVRVQMEMCEKMQIRIPSAEEYLMEFLEEEVKPLWPKGWMTSKRLYKESHDAHARWTDAEMLLKTKKAGSKPGTPVNVGGASVTSAVMSNAAATATTHATSPIPTAPITVHTSPIRISPSQPEAGSSLLKISPTRPAHVSPMPHLSPVMPVASSADNEAHSPHPPNLLDYATNSWVSAKSGAGKAVSTGALSFTTTNMLGTMGSMTSLASTSSTASQALKSMSLLAGQEQNVKANRKIQLQEENVSSSTSVKKAAMSEAKTSKEPPKQVSPTSSGAQPVTGLPVVKPIQKAPNDFMAQFRAFTQTFKAPSPASDSSDTGNSLMMPSDAPEPVSPTPADVAVPATTAVSWAGRSPPVGSKASSGVTLERSGTMPFSPSLQSVKELSPSKQGVQIQPAKPVAESTYSTSYKNPFVSAANSSDIVNRTSVSSSTSSALSSNIAVVKPRPTVTISSYTSPQSSVTVKSKPQTLSVSSSASQQAAKHPAPNIDQRTPTGPPKSGLFSQRKILGQMHPPQASVSQVKPRLSPGTSYSNQQVSPSSSPAYPAVSSGSHSGQSSRQHTGSPSMSGVSVSGGIPVSPSSPRAAGRSMSPSGQYSRSGVSSTSPSQHRSAAGLISGQSHMHVQRPVSNTGHTQIARPIVKVSVDSRQTVKAVPKTSPAQSNVHSTNPGIPQVRSSTTPNASADNSVLAKLAYSASRKSDSHTVGSSSSSHQYVLHGGIGSALQSVVPASTLHSTQLGYAQTQYAKSHSPAGVHDRHASSSSVTSSVPRDQPLYGGLSFDQLQAQAVSAANKQRLPVTQQSLHPANAHSILSSGPSLWRPDEHIVTPSTLSSNSYGLSHIATTVGSLYLQSPPPGGLASPYVGINPILGNTQATLPSPDALIHQGSNPFNLQSSPQARTSHHSTSPHSAQSHHY